MIQHLHLNRQDMIVQGLYQGLSPLIKLGLADTPKLHMSKSLAIHKYSPSHLLYKLPQFNSQLCIWLGSQADVVLITDCS